MHQEVEDQINARYTKWEASIADTHAEYMSAREDITHKMQEVVQMQVKAKEMVSLVHEA